MQSMDKIQAVYPADKGNPINQITSAGALRLQRGAGQIPSTQKAAQVQAGQPGSAQIHTQPQVPFGDLLRQELQRELQKESAKSDGVQFSKHAAKRVQERGIEMTEGMMKNLNRAVEKAREKGAKDVVVIGEKNAFIVNVPNNVVVTTMSGKEMKENIFTNIDSAVLM